MKSILFYMLIIFFFMFIIPADRIELPGAMNPGWLSLDASHFYISDGASVMIIDRESGQTASRFGSSGEGPREFRLVPGTDLVVYPHGDRLIVNSVGKLSLFSRNGKYIDEIRTPGRGSQFIPIGEGYLGVIPKTGRENNELSIQLFDSGLKPVRELMHGPNSFQAGPNGKYLVYPSFMAYQAVGGEALISDPHEFVVHIFDGTGREIGKLTHPFEPPPFGAEDRRRLIDYFKSFPQMKSLDEASIQQLFLFPDRLPSVLEIRGDESRFYIMTFRHEGEKYLFYIFDRKGKFLKQSWVRLPFRDAMRPRPFAIDKGVLYFIEENEEKETFAIVSTKIL